jgi:CheY-like chemotaxis protein
LLPGIGGEEVLHALKREPLTKQIPVIILSRLPPTKSAELKAAGAADYFEKSRLTDHSDGEAAFLSAIDAVLRESERVNGVRKYVPLAAGS